MLSSLYVYLLTFSKHSYLQFKYLGSVLTRDGYCTSEIKMRIAIAKEAFNRKMSLLTSKLNWLGVMFGALLYMAQRPGH